MNKLKTVINNLRYTGLLLVFILIGVTVNGQNTSQSNASTQDTIQATKALDTIPVSQQKIDSIDSFIYSV